MKRAVSLALLCAATLGLSAQTMKIHTGQVTVAVPAAEAGQMAYTDGGTRLTVMGKTYDTAGIDSITVDDASVEKDCVRIDYQGTQARVLVSGDVAPLLTVTATGADVSILADGQLDREVTYVLSGNSSNGFFWMDGEYKCTVKLDGLTLHNTRGAAIDIENGKRINVVLADGTTNTLSDSEGGLQKACFFVNGHPEFSGAGTLVLTGNSKHAFASDEYTLLKPGFGTIRVEQAANDGLHVDQYFRMQGGTLDIRGTAGDCVDVSVTKDPTDEDNGCLFIEGGSLTLDVAADDTKGLKCENAMTLSGGTITAKVSGDGSKGISTGTDLLIQQQADVPVLIDFAVTGTTYMPGDPELESKCRGIKVKNNFTFDGGTIRISATGAKSKAISVDGTYTYKSGSLNCAVDAEITVDASGK